MHRSNEPFWWSLFAAGGTLAAFLAPVLIVLTGIAGPLGWIPAGALDHDSLHLVVTHPAAKLLLFAFISLTLCHWAHRFRFALFDLGIKAARRSIGLTCYGLALAGTLAAVLVLWKV